MFGPHTNRREIFIETLIPISGVLAVPPIPLALSKIFFVLNQNVLAVPPISLNSHINFLFCTPRIIDSGTNTLALSEVFFCFTFKAIGGATNILKLS